MFCLVFACLLVVLAKPLPHPPWRPSCSRPSKHEAEHGRMVRKEGGGPASKYKIEKKAIIYGRTGATHWGRHAKCS